MNYKGIWKTGVLAVAVTIAFAIFIFRAAEWTRGLNSEFLVYGQATGGGTTGATGTTGGTSVTKVIPQIAVGGFGDGNQYSTVIQIVNTNSTPITISANFYTQTGAASLVSLTTNVGATINNGVLGSTSLAANSVLVITGVPASATTTGAVAWGKLISSGTVSIATFFEIRDAVTRVLGSRVGVQASPANMASFVIPRTRNVAAGLDVAFAIVNAGSTSANLTATLKDASGNIIAGPKVVPASSAPGAPPLGPGGQIALFTREFFALVNEPSGSNYHYVVFDGGNAAQFAAVALAYEGTAQTSFPVDQLR